MQRSIVCSVRHPWTSWHLTRFPLYWKKEIQRFSSPISEFSRCFRSQFAAESAEIYKKRDIHHWCSPFIAVGLFSYTILCELRLIYNTQHPYDGKVTNILKFAMCTFNFGAAIGSEKPKKGRARLTKPFLYMSRLVWHWTNYMYTPTDNAR